MADVLFYTATQNIPQRGHRESEDSENRGNFLAIMEKWKSGNAKYTSNTTQKEVFGRYVLQARDMTGRLS